MSKHETFKIFGMTNKEIAENKKRLVKKRKIEKRDKLYVRANNANFTIEKSK